MINCIKNIIYKIVDKFSFKQEEHLSKYSELDKLTLSEVQDYQFKKLQELFERIRLPKINTWEDFYKFPITTKNDLISKPLFPDLELKQHETSGSTGQPRVIWVPKEAWYRKDAIFSRSWKKMGRKNSDWVFRLISGEPQYPIYDWWRNVKAMNYKTIGQEHVDWVVKNKPFLIHGPGGAIRQLCEMIISQGKQEVLKEIKIHWCSESSAGHKERLVPFVKEFHEQYGLAELPTVGATDGKGHLKIVAEVGIIEIVDENGNQVEDGKEGFIIVTDLNNYQTPIIRYKCGDRGKKRKFTNLNGEEYYILHDVIGRGVDYYNGPEVKRAIGWWIVAPISHIAGHIISKWRCIVFPKLRKAVLYVKFKNQEDYESLKAYQNWFKENVGLNLEISKIEDSQDEKYDIYWKNKLVKVIS